VPPLATRKAGRMPALPDIFKAGRQKSAAELLVRVLV